MSYFNTFARRYNSAEIAAFVATVGTYKFPGQALFPHEKQDGITIDDFKTKKSTVKVLDMSNFDTVPLLRDREGIRAFTEQMPLFREHMVITEKQRQELLDAIKIGGDRLDSKVALLNKDALTLVNGGLLALEAMRMQLLFYGMLNFATESTGVSKVVDYGFDAASQHFVQAGTDAWDQPATANPLEHLLELKESADNAGDVAVYMSSKTMNKMLQCEAVKGALFPTQSTSTMIPPAMSRQLISDNYGLSIVPIDASMPTKYYKQAKTGDVPLVEDGRIALAPKGVLGATKFGTTPEEADVQFGVKDANVSIVEDGIAITTKTSDDGFVTIDTKVSMISLPIIDDISALRTMKVF